jgi:hypothetical protein
MIENMGNCMLNLKLIGENAQGVKESLSLELTIAQFQELFAELQKIKGMIELIN